MARPRTLGEQDMIARLARVFSEVGYEGASLSRLSQATGLQRASLYHRFPGGKQQMAEEVLGMAGDWLERSVFAPLRESGPAADRLAGVVAEIDRFYDGGRKACLLNMLSAPRDRQGPFAPAIRGAFVALIDALTAFAAGAGLAESDARARALRVVTLLQGSLVLSRGLGSDAPFKTVLAGIPAELIPEEGRS